MSFAGDPALLFTTDLADLLQRPEWHADALCREYPLVNFFPHTGEPAAPAREVCSRCIVRHECFAWAMAQDPLLAGVWAGTTSNERRALRRNAA